MEPRQEDGPGNNAGSSPDVQGKAKARPLRDRYACQAFQRLDIAAFCPRHPDGRAAPYERRAFPSCQFTIRGDAPYTICTSLFKIVGRSLASWVLHVYSRTWSGMNPFVAIPSKREYQGVVFLPRSGRRSTSARFVVQNSFLLIGQGLRHHEKRTLAPGERTISVVIDKIVKIVNFRPARS